MEHPPRNLHADLSPNLNDYFSFALRVPDIFTIYQVFKCCLSNVIFIPTTGFEPALGL